MPSGAILERTLKIRQPGNKRNRTRPDHPRPICRITPQPDIPAATEPPADLDGMGLDELIGMRFQPNGGEELHHTIPPIHAQFWPRTRVDVHGIGLTRRSNPDLNIPGRRAWQSENSNPRIAGVSGAGAGRIAGRVHSQSQAQV